MDKGPECVKVGMRVRPLNSKEKLDNQDQSLSDASWQEMFENVMGNNHP